MEGFGRGREKIILLLVGASECAGRVGYLMHGMVVEARRKIFQGCVSWREGCGNYNVDEKGAVVEVGLLEVCFEIGYDIALHTLQYSDRLCSIFPCLIENL